MSKGSENALPRHTCADTPSPTVILVEDDPAVLGALAFAFETDGYAVRSYANAEALLAAPPDRGRHCLVIDEKLPGLSGLDLLARLRIFGVATPAILITSNPTYLTRRRAAAAGVEIVEKPLLGDRLSKMVRAALTGER
jgi:two-component system, LuxR family, response regulator FixJ